MPTTPFVLAAGAAALLCDVEASPAREVAAVATGIIAADNAGALDRVLAFYAPDAVLLPPGQAPVAGKGAIRPRYEALFAAFSPELVARVDEACASGSMAFVRGHNRGRLAARSGAGHDQEVDDPYLMLLRRDGDGSWRITHLMWHRSADLWHRSADPSPPK